jgi:hypothetical protein
MVWSGIVAHGWDRIKKVAYDGEGLRRHGHRRRPKDSGGGEKRMRSRTLGAGGRLVEGV